MAALGRRSNATRSTNTRAVQWRYRAGTHGFSVVIAVLLATGIAAAVTAVILRTPPPVRVTKRVYVSAPSVFDGRTLRSLAASAPAYMVEARFDGTRVLDEVYSQRENGVWVEMSATSGQAPEYARCERAMALVRSALGRSATLRAVGDPGLFSAVIGWSGDQEAAVFSDGGYGGHVPFILTASQLRVRQAQSEVTPFHVYRGSVAASTAAATLVP